MHNFPKIRKETCTDLIKKYIFPSYVFSQLTGSLVETASRFWKIFDAACTFYKILENASKLLHALQTDCCMEAFRKFFDVLSKKFIHFLCNIENFLQNFVIIFNNQFFLKVKSHFGGFKNCFMKRTKN